MERRPLWPGAPLALGAALLFGASTPLAKPLLGATPPWLLAGLLYLGAGAGTGALWLAARWVRPVPRQAALGRRDLPWLGGAIAAGGMLAPVLLMEGLRETAATSASLLLNLEGVFTLLIAWTVFRENVSIRVGIGAAAILVGAGALTWEGLTGFGPGAWLIGAACLLWAVDNSLSRQVSAADPLQVAAIKGGVAGLTNTALAVWHGAAFPALGTIAAAAGIGAVAYGVSLAMYVAAMRHLGSARTAAYFSVAPFVGASLGVLLLGEALSGRLLLSGGLMAVGLYLHLAERHGHVHGHEALLHEHAHVHDAHHRHPHRGDDPLDEPHSHKHAHGPLVHEHPHYPDIHHRHGH